MTSTPEDYPSQPDPQDLGDPDSPEFPSVPQPWNNPPVFVDVPPPQTPVSEVEDLPRMTPEAEANAATVIQDVTGFPSEELEIVPEPEAEG